MACLGAKGSSPPSIFLSPPCHVRDVALAAVLVTLCLCGILGQWDDLNLPLNIWGWHHRRPGEPWAPHAFQPSPLQPNGFLVPQQPQCQAEYRSDLLPFEECAAEVLRAAASTTGRRGSSSRGSGEISTSSGCISGSNSDRCSQNEGSKNSSGRGSTFVSSGSQGNSYSVRAGAAAAPPTAALGIKDTGASGVAPSVVPTDGQGRLLRGASWQHKIQQEQKQEEQQQLSQMHSRSVEWITYVTSCGRSSNRMAKAVSSTGIPLTVLALGTFWKWRWGYRMRLLHDYLVGMEDQKKLIIFTDASDVVPVPGATSGEVVERYERLVARFKGPRIFFAAETACYPDGELWSKYPDPKTITGSKGASPFRYLNAGTMIGPAGLVRQMLELVYQHDCSDDQYLYSMAHLDPILWWKNLETGRISMASSTESTPGITELPKEALPLIGLDHWNELFLAMYGVKREDILVGPAGKTITFPLTGGRPIIVHQNGDKRFDHLLEFLCEQFGYESTWNASTTHLT